jgi:hypothetical protein
MKELSRFRGEAWKKAESVGCGILDEDAEGIQVAES